MTTTTTQATPLHIFVYGTLRRGERADLSRSLPFLSEGSIQGSLYRGSSYPMAFHSTDPEDRIIGEVFSIHSSLEETILRRLDQYEGAVGDDPLYRREIVAVATPTDTVYAWVYFYADSSTDGLTLIPSGDWKVRPSHGKEASAT